MTNTYDKTGWTRGKINWKEEISLSGHVLKLNAMNNLFN